ncbi:uncharacterized protein ALTATR162_LOCUS10436 [Alternaria atra]|uniref:Uncharacterized protein n=1 Tax=Alternaria atra TaxID=119953 RepID=A0A8J2IFQ5_9PLEO|nr:uncharacterized protein ALTATR162_LOCUS10436 [Alternaria atra]CAG5183108.1 unnamed protein product [Alternaria atra]
MDSERQLSSSGRIAIMDVGTRIKREDVDDAVKKVRMFQTRTIGAGISKPSRGLEANFLLRYSPEIHNEIYAHALGVKSYTSTNTRVVRWKHTKKSLSDGTTLLRLCKEITVEVRSMLEARAVPHIPIMAYMNFNKLTACVIRD